MIMDFTVLPTLGPGRWAWLANLLAAGVCPAVEELPNRPLTP
jgi:hypothetical protein